MIQKKFPGSSSSLGIAFIFPCIKHEYHLLWNSLFVFLQAASSSASIVRSQGDGFTISSLFVSYASSKDSGAYQCIPSNTGPASINVHVLDGKEI